LKLVGGGVVKDSQELLLVLLNELHDELKHVRYSDTGPGLSQVDCDSTRDSDETASSTDDDDDCSSGSSVVADDLRVCQLLIISTL